jgi:hypothetical protein
LKLFGRYKLTFRAHSMDQGFRSSQHRGTRRRCHVLRLSQATCECFHRERTFAHSRTSHVSLPPSSTTPLVHSSPPTMSTLTPKSPSFSVPVVTLRTWRLQRTSRRWHRLVCPMELEWPSTYVIAIPIESNTDA